MSPIKFDFVADNKPNNLPTAEEIIQQCSQAYAANLSSGIRGIALVDRSKDGPVCAWVKFSHSVNLMAEARTQHYVAQVVNNNDAAPVRVPDIYCSFESNSRGYIVMEYIEGEICRNADIRLVAAAVQFLITIEGPTKQPGPVGGGLIGHDFFIDRESSVTYSSVELLEKHINGILAHEGRPRQVRVNLKPEVDKFGLLLCPSDMNRGNFMKDRNNKIVALDYGLTCFLPFSFFDLTLQNSTGDRFTERLRQLIPRPESTQLEALLIASRSLVPYQTNRVGLPHELRQRPNK